MERVPLPLADEDPCGAPPSRPPLDADDATRLADRLKALADPTRLRLLSLVMSCDSACICDLTEPVGLSQPTVSHHMKVLVEAGLLDRGRRGRWVHYTVRRDAFRELSDLLGDPQRSLHS